MLTKSQRDLLPLKTWLPIFGLLAVLSVGVGAEVQPRTNATERVSGKWKTIAELKTAAEAGNARAQVELGTAYLRGVQDLPQDKVVGLQWLRKAAGQGDNMGQWMLGQCLDRGEGGPTNTAEALDWWQKSAQQNNPLAQMELGFCYLNGRGVVSNKTEGFRLLTAAAETGSPVPQFMLGFAYQAQAMLVTNDPVDIKKAAEWFTKSADQGFENAQFMLGQCYQYGRGVEKDPVEAYKWFLVANRRSVRPVMPPELMDTITARQMREGLEKARAFVPRTNAVTFSTPAMPDWMDKGAAGGK